VFMTPPSTETQNSYLMAALCFGLLASAVALDALHPEREVTSDLRQYLWNGFQFGLPVAVGGLCLTGKRWACMVGVMYGTVGLALDIATFVQSMTSEMDSLHFVGLILLTTLFNFLLIVIGGRQVLTL